MGASGGEVTVTDYTLHGKLVTHLTRGSDEMHFFYDAQSRPAMVDFNGVVYSYVHNLQGDIVGILDNAGSLVVEYKYDAWGKPTLVRTLTTAYEALAELNPFRYRGYVYDEETELYYLRSRYYSPEHEKFLNADGIIGIGHGLLKHNLFAYCFNMPVRLKDTNGKSATEYILQQSQSIASLDGPYPFADAVVGVLIVGALLFDAISQSNAREEDNTDEDTDEDTDEETDEQSAKIVFPSDPSLFLPLGLVPDVHPGSKNGKVITWAAPNSKIAIFRWDENLNYPNGPHYHIETPEYSGVHFYPGDEIPEPYASLYFGG